MSRPEPVASSGRRLLAAAALLHATVASAEDWPGPTPAERAMSAPQVDPRAGAEVLLWDVRVDHDPVGRSGARTETWTYLRIKVFGEAGREKLKTIRLACGPACDISSIAARTIGPDGAIGELRDDAVRDETEAGTRPRRKAFDLPGIAPGSILEYRWKTTEPSAAGYARLEFQRELPVHLVRYRFRPAARRSLGMSSMSLNLNATPFADEADGYFTTTAERMPAFEDEPDMPSPASVRSWMLVYYSANPAEPPEQLRARMARRLHEQSQGVLKLDTEMRAAAREAVADAPDDESRLRRLFDFVTARVDNTSFDLDEGDDADQSRPPENWTTADTWKRKAGTAQDLRMVYIALAGALGYDARLALVSRSDLGGFQPGVAHPYFLRSANVAVRVGGGWRFCDPGYPFLPFGVLDASEQGQRALVADPSRPELVATPVAPPDVSETRREGTLRLAADGSLEGEVRVSYTAHAATLLRARYRGQSAAAREEAVREEARSTLGAAEVTGIVIEGLSASSPLSVAYRLKVPAYAQLDGPRVSLRPALFQRRAAPRFSASVRRYPVAFASAWSERDLVVYHLPERLSLAGPTEPSRINITGVGEYVAHTTASADGRTLRYERRFDFGREGRLSFPPSVYPAIKQAFDSLHQMDVGAVELRSDSPR